MRKHRFEKRCLSVLFALVLLVVSFPTAIPTTAATVKEQIAALEKEQAALKAQINAAKGDMANSKKTRDLYTSQINNVVKQINLLDNKISELSKQSSQKDTTIAAMEREIAAKEAEKAEVQRMLGERLRAIDKRGNATTLQMLLNTDDYADYLLKAKLMEVVAEKDQAAIDALEAKLAEIAADEEKVKNEKLSLEAQKKETQELKAQSDKKKKELDILYSKANAVYQADKNEVAKLNKELEETEASIKKLLASINSTGVYTTMYWPVPTIRRITSNFGPRWGTLHKGIDIANGAAYGHSIVAAADGTVIYSNTTSSWGGGYGYYCMVDHGKDSKGRQIVTLYAHMSKNQSYVGQKVKGGKTVLGKIGSTGNSTGPHLHFEVRVNGTPVDPLQGYVSIKGK